VSYSDQLILFPTLESRLGKQAEQGRNRGNQVVLPRIPQSSIPFARSRGEGHRMPRLCLLVIPMSSSSSFRRCFDDSHLTEGHVGHNGQPSEQKAPMNRVHQKGTV
jgi:hypothetical protein